ncbi:MAG TPA: hypothetical protein VFZ91_01755 [Allosphingosinicella sp.]
MDNRHSGETRERGRIFAAPVRRLSPDEIDLVGGGDETGNEFGGKICGGVDNHSKEM